MSDGEQKASKGEEHDSKFDPNSAEAQKFAQDYAKTQAQAFEQQLSELRTENEKYKGIDLDRARALIDAEEKGRLKNGEHEKLIAEQTEKVKSGYQKQLDEALSKTETISKERDALKSRITASEIARAAAANGVQSTAIDDVIARLGSSFTINSEGKVTATDGVIDSKGGALTIEAAIKSLQSTAPHLFGQAAGSGASGNRSAGANSTSDLQRSKMSAKQKSDYVVQHGQDAYLALKY